ncbi:isopenicillin N synthase family dioxygenase [Phenylobacterium sp.]|uniref:isopenicillin N synthase family dioxygenase n=1 Tax=Phenylobacterium sp. TaxID=1871053 RepID=UPI002F403C1F
MSQAGIPPVSFGTYAHDFPGFTRDLGGSFERFGFAVVTEYDLPQARVDAALADAKAFFALPGEVKRRYETGAGHQRGYTPFGVETAKGAAHYDLKEFWHVGRGLPPGHRYEGSMPHNVWPAEIPRFREHVGWLYGALDGLGRKLLQSVAAYLDLERGFFESTVDEGNSILRLLHYPPAPFDGPNERAAAHEDINVITLLLGAEEAGLEVKDRDGRWLPVNPPPGALVCNIGDMLQRLTNHRLPSTSHRVVNPAPQRRGTPRYSTPFFLHFNSDYLIRTLPGCVDAAHPDRYPQPITADAFLMERLREIKLL